MSTDASQAGLPASVKRYAWYLMFMAGLGGLLYGIDVGVISAALPYIQETSTYTPAQLSSVVAAVLFGSVLSSLFAGMLAEVMGRKKVIIVSALLFTLSIPVICFSNNEYFMLMAGRVLQGASAGLVGVVVPMYLAECLDAQSRGKGTGMFQFLLTVGLVFAALIGLIITQVVGDATDVVVPAESKTMAWQLIFWCSALPGLLLFFGAFKLKESPRWLYRRGRENEALLALAANNGEEAARTILAEMKAADKAEEEKKTQMAEQAKGDSLCQRKYVIPFILAVVVLACTQATGINSVLNYCVTVLKQSGLEGTMANWAELAIKVVNMLMTIVAVSLVDKKGRTFLLKMGTIGIIVGLIGVGAAFLSVEKGRVDVTEFVKDKVAQLDGTGAELRVSVNEAVQQVAAEHPEFLKDGKAAEGMQLIVTYKQGTGWSDSNQVVAEQFDRDAKSKAVAAAKLTSNGAEVTYEDKGLTATDLAKKAEEAKAALGAAQKAKDTTATKISDRIRKDEVSVEGDKDAIVKDLQLLESNSDRAIIEVAFDDKTADLKPLEVTRAEVGMKTSATTGWIVTIFFIIYIAFYAAGPGVCVWLALSELMPNRIRANGMAIALLINQGVSTTIAAVFLPWVGAMGYSTVFFTLAGFTVIYFITAAFFMPETKGRTLEQIEQYFATGKMPEDKKEDEEEQKA